MQQNVASCNFYLSENTKTISALHLLDSGTHCLVLWIRWQLWRINTVLRGGWRSLTQKLSIFWYNAAPPLFLWFETLMIVIVTGREWCQWRKCSLCSIHSNLKYVIYALKIRTLLQWGQHIPKTKWFKLLIVLNPIVACVNVFRF